MKRFAKALIVLLPLLIAHVAVKVVRRREPPFKKFAADSRESYVVREYEL